MTASLHLQRGADWSFRNELEQTVPHQIALPDLDEEGFRLALALMANHVTAEDGETLRVARFAPGGVVRTALLHLPSMRWQAVEGSDEGRGFLELATWLCRRTLMGTACLLGVALPLLRGRH